MTRKKTHNQFIKEVQEVTNGEYYVLTKYKKSSEKVKVLHIPCNKVWEVTPNNILRGRTCPNCPTVTPHERFCDKVLEITKGRLKVIGKYKGHLNKVLVLCTKHSIKFTTYPKYITNGREVCKQCNIENIKSSQRKSEKQFKKDILNKHNGRITPVDKYVNTHTKIRFKCKVCDHIFSAEPNAVIRTSGCPNCKKSKGEQLISDTLDSLGVYYIRQYSFEQCRYKRTLYFDFFLPEHNLLIEYDGKQHYYPIKFFGGINGYKETVKRDYVKTVFAEKNGITLIRIPYTVQGDELVNLVTDKVK